MAEIAGLKLIVPSSVAGSGVSVSASGKVTFTAATSISVNGVFSATYDNYLAVVQYKFAAASNTAIRVRASGTDATTNYTYQSLEASNTTVAGERGSIGNAFAGDAGTDTSGIHIYFYGPYLSQATALRTVTVSSRNGGRILDFANTHSTASAYDGFTLYPTGATNGTGTLTVYGLSQ
jgi:hypothetical protein